MYSGSVAAMRWGLLSLGLCAGAAEIQEDWTAFKAAFGKSYGATEEAERFRLFNRSWSAVRQHSSDAFALSLYEWSDWTEAEFLQRKTGFRPSNTSVFTDGTYTPAAEVLDVSKKRSSSLDWRCNGTNPLGISAVTPVKDQGSCGNCWAYSGGGAAEGGAATSSALTLDLSVQQIHDCNAPGYGCNGGTIEAALSYFIDEGLELTADYPTTNSDASSCAADESRTAAKGLVALGTQFDESGLMDMLYQYGPATASLDAGCDAFMHYKGGVLTEECSSSCVTHNHAVLIVGYGYDYGAQLPYWIAKNSWGIGWGESGYVRIAQTGNRGGTAGILCTNYAIGRAQTFVQEPSYSEEAMNNMYLYCNETLGYVGDDEDDAW
mmetsp:Transcript_16064/g.61254  ORF Transcript_16064/g.61254 Transcript_16064/m.61254 type:complete len:378 (+) Transcript_16064:85-1218(+)